MIPVKRTHISLEPNPKKVVLRFLDYGRERMVRIYSVIKSRTESECAEVLDRVLMEFKHRHSDMESVLGNHYKVVRNLLGENDLDGARALLLGSYFTHEFSVESAALFNPSIVMHPDQTGLDSGEYRFVISLRLVGEGHISSLGFRTGTVREDGGIHLAGVAGQWNCGMVQADSDSGEDYDVFFDKSAPLESQVIFPYSSIESNGIEDVRFVRFNNGNEYYGTYTAYDGKSIRSRLIHTADFRSFQIRRLSGDAIIGKGMALFPEKINGKFVITGRQGGQEMSIMFSEDLYKWDHYQAIQSPRRYWGLLQLGNCGSPVKTSEGWLLLTHAVGPMRKYVISASLLDIENPGILLASLDEPLMLPLESEREGYVPNVLYTCGCMEVGENLIIPYAMSDSRIGIARVQTRDLVDALVNQTRVS